MTKQLLAWNHDCQYAWSLNHKNINFIHSAYPYALYPLHKLSQSSRVLALPSRTPRDVTARHNEGAFLKAHTHVLAMHTVDTHARGRERIHSSLPLLLGYGARTADSVFFSFSFVVTSNPLSQHRTAHILGTQ